MQDEHNLDGRSLLDIGSDFDDPVEEIGDTNELDSFTNDENESLALHQVRRAVRKYGEESGITVPELEEVTDLSPKTIRRHLDNLRRLREVYRTKRNKQTYFYYPNGKPLHSFGKKRIDHDKDTIIDIQLAEGKNEEYFFHLTEKRASLIEGETVEGAIILPTSFVDELTEKLEEFREEVA